MITLTQTSSLTIFTPEIKKHPTLPFFLREDGALLNAYVNHWVFGVPIKSGYLRYKQYNMHRLVCETFHENTENKYSVDHINRIRNDNRACNLRWATAKEQYINSATYDKRLKGNHIRPRFVSEDERRAYSKDQARLRRQKGLLKMKECYAQNCDKMQEKERKYFEKNLRKAGLLP